MEHGGRQGTSRAIPDLATAAFPLVVSGPSGVGKTVLCDRLCEAYPWAVLSVSTTTRSPRGEERDGESYFFTTHEQFVADRAAGRMAEWAEVHGHLYGTPREYLDRNLRAGKCVVLNIDVQGGLNVRRAYPEAHLVFVLPPSMEVLEARLRQRGTDSPDEVARRLETARREIGELQRYDSVIVNDDLERAVSELMAVAAAERTRIARRLAG